MSEAVNEPESVKTEKVCANCMWWACNRGVVPIVTEDKACWEPHQEQPWTDDQFTCEYHVGSDTTEVNVPQHCPNGTMKEPNPNPVNGPTEILIVTYSKDFPWLEYALKCIKKYAKGFQGVTVAHPAHEAEMFNKLHSNFKVRLHGYSEVAGKGMLQHMVKMAEADKIVPRGTKYVLHMDADCMFKMPVTPEDYFWRDKPYQLIRTWASLGVPDPRYPTSKAISDCAQWKGATDRQLGFDGAWYTMCMNTAVFPIEFYAKYRTHIEKVHHRSFQDFMLDGVNSFPQSNMDWTAMGAFARECMGDEFTWFDVEDGQPYPVDRKQAYWSHGGMTDVIKAEIEGFLK